MLVRLREMYRRGGLGDCFALICVITLHPKSEGKKLFFDVRTPPYKRTPFHHEESFEFRTPCPCKRCSGSENVRYFSRKVMHSRSYLSGTVRRN